MMQGPAMENDRLERGAEIKEQIADLYIELHDLFVEDESIKNIEAEFAFWHTDLIIIWVLVGYVKDVFRALPIMGRWAFNYHEMLKNAVMTGETDHFDVHDVKILLMIMPYDEYLKTAHWKLTREDALERAQQRCQVCNTDKRPLHVHHRSYERRGMELPEDLTVLCGNCHKLFHENSKLKKPKRASKFGGQK
jgi:hypothetical protein